ncbi:MAG: HlyD family efflux transporter periplasmic adaptor subunit [Chlamydiota bacterium]
MYRKYLLPLIAVLGVTLGVIATIVSARKIPPQPIAFLPPSPPYAHFIAGQGTIEATSENIQIGTPFNEIATDVYVVAGDFVKEGDPLFKLNVETPEANLFAAEMDLAHAAVEYENQKTQLDLYDSLSDTRAVSKNEYNQVYYAAEAAKVAIAQAEANILVVQTIIDRSTIRAPLDGRVLQVNIRPGESANFNPFNQMPLITFGPAAPLHVRVNIDEDDAWRFRKGTAATAFVRGNSSICFPLHFVRMEPLVIAKQALTGASTERVDTRVLQAIYSFDCERLPVFIGQILDVYIESIPADTRYGHAQIHCH